MLLPDSQSIVKTLIHHQGIICRLTGSRPGAKPKGRVGLLSQTGKRSLLLGGGNKKLSRAIAKASRHPKPAEELKLTLKNDKL